MRVRTIGIPVVALALVFSYPGTAPADPSARPSRPVVPVTADVTITRVTVDSTGTHTAQERQRYVRDSNARTRTEAGSIVTISDPAAGTTTALDTKNGTSVRR